jgi:hypothetical protein
MSTTPSLSERLRNAAIRRESLGSYVRALMFEAADALEAKEPQKDSVEWPQSYRPIVKESGVS